LKRPTRSFSASNALPDVYIDIIFSTLLARSLILIIEYLSAELDEEEERTEEEKEFSLEDMNYLETNRWKKSQNIMRLYLQLVILPTEN